MEDCGLVAADDARLAFDGVAEIYDQVRPAYPDALLQALFAMLPPSPRILEVGPGTGQATGDLLERGAVVHAIEIGPALAARLRSNLSSDRLQIAVGPFEDVDVGAHCFDAVFSATAYHWIEPNAQTDRPAHVLKPGGLLAVVDTIQVDSSADRGFFSASQPIYERFGEGHTGPPAPSRDDADPPMRLRLEADDRYRSVEVRRYDWNQTYSARSYRQLMLSYSGTQMMNASDRLGLLDAIESFIRDEFDDTVTRPLVATLTTATLVG